MQPKLVALTLIVVCISKVASAGNIADACSPVITPDKSALSDNIALDLAYYGSVTSQNYEEKKKDASVSIFGSMLAASADYSDFAKRRQDLSQTIRRDTKLNIQKDILIYSIGAEKTAAYSDCVKKLTSRPVSVYIEHATPTIAVVNFLRQQDGKSTTAGVTLSVTGGKFVDESGNLVSKMNQAVTGGGSSIYIVKRELGEDLLIVANLKDNENGATATDFVSVPKYVNIGVEKIDVPSLEATSQPKCGGGAGCGYTNGPFTASTYSTLVAPSDTFLDYKAVSVSYNIHLEDCGGVDPSIQYGTKNDHMIEFLPSFKLVGSDQCSRTVAAHIIVPAYKLKYEALYE